MKSPTKPITTLNDGRKTFDAAARMKRQFDELVEHTQRLVRASHLRRAEFWQKADRSSPEAWEKSCRFYRDYLWDEIVGRFPFASAPPNPRTRRAYQRPKWDGYEVTLDVWPGVFAYGVLLVPRDIPKGERRPVVVCQHGRGGRPQDVIEASEQKRRTYGDFAARLAEEGYVVFAPQNPYLGEERYRQLQRKANPLKKTFFALVARQHEQALEWLKSLPFVDGRRIAFYGLSYGGKTAMLVPPLLPDYAAVICSGDFNETVWKHTALDSPISFMLTIEYEHTEFDLGHTFNYAELAGLIAPRPFMVERGHRDGVGIDEWVAFEYAKVRRLYGELGIKDRTEIEFFDGGHEIHLVGTAEFLRKHLRWPAGEAEK